MHWVFEYIVQSIPTLVPYWQAGGYALDNFGINQAIINWAIETKEK